MLKNSLAVNSLAVKKCVAPCKMDLKVVKSNGGQEMASLMI